MKKTVSLILSVTFLLGIFSLESFAYSPKKYTGDEWSETYNELSKVNTTPTFCVGTDSTNLSLVWHAAKATAKAQVKLSKNQSMTDATIFEGTTTEAETDSQLVCRVTMTGIEPNSTYYYQWFSDNGWSKPCRYDSKGTEKYKTLVIGDIQIGGQTTDSAKQSDDSLYFNNVLAEALTKNDDVSFLLSPGDNTSTGKTSEEWQSLLVSDTLRSLPMALAIGNHDKKGFSYNYFTNMPNEYYGKYFEELDRDFYFRYNDVLYLVYDATSASAADHMAMTKQAVSENQDAKWRIAVMHQALFGPSYSMLDSETGLLLNAVFTPIFDSYDIDLVLTGHSHLQGRSHFMYESMVIGKAKSGNTYKNPLGTIYLNSNAICDHTKSTLDINLPYIAYEFTQNDVTTYTTLEFSGNTMDIKTFRGDNSELLDSVSIEKTAEHNDNKPHKRLHRFVYKFVEFCGRMYQVIDNLIVSIRGGHF